jgi:hypothetical protein
LAQERGQEETIMHPLSQSVRTLPVSLLAGVLGLAGCATSGPDITTPEAARMSAPLRFEAPVAPTEVAASDAGDLASNNRVLSELDALISQTEEPSSALTVPVSMRGAIAFGAPFDAEPGHDDAAAAGKTSQASELAKQSQNPVANLMSLPVEFNFNQDAGYRKNTQTIVNVKPVIPQQLSDDWNLIHRLIVPVIDQPKLSEESYSRFGLGDTVYQGFFSPTKKLGGKLIWGVGPQVGLPTATDDVLGSDQWTLGPAAVALVMEGPWVAGALVSNAWTVAANDSSRSNVRAMTLQPFVNYNMGEGWYVVSAPVITSNWAADQSGDAWTVPVGAGVGRVFHIGSQAVNLRVAGYYNAHRPDDASRWTLQFEINFLFPESH